MSRDGRRGAPLVPFAYAFRPLFLAAFAWALVGVPAWMLVRAAGATPLPGVPPQLWHGHEMLFGFVAAAIAGFLLTSVPSWTGRRGFAGAPLVALSAIWLAGRFGLAFAGSLPWAVVAGAALAFLPALAVLIAPPLLRENNRNTPLLLVLLALWLADAAFLLGVRREDAALAGTALRVALDLVLVVVTVVGGRIVPLTTSSVLRRAGVAAHARRHDGLDRATIAAMALMAVVDALAPGGTAAGLAAAVAALLHALRLAGWQGLRAGVHPEAWPLQLPMLWLAVGLGMKAVHLLAGVAWGAEWLHALTVGTLAPLIVAVAVRTTLAYTGRALQPGRVVIAALLVLGAAAVVRVIAVPGLSAREALLGLATLLWAIAFAVVLAVQGPVLLRPRVESRER